MNVQRLGNIPKVTMLQVCSLSFLLVLAWCFCERLLEEPGNGWL